MPRQHHGHRLTLRGFGYLKRFGPGLITGASDDDPSGIGTYSQVGAQFRFEFLWTALVSLPLAAAVQETAARLGLASGDGFATLIKRRYSRPILFLSVLLVASANVFNIAADLMSMAAALRVLTPIPFQLGVLAFGSGVIAIEIFLPYHAYSRVLRLLTISLLAYIGVLGVVQIDWVRVLRSTVVPSLSIDRTHIAALIAVFGTTISPYLFFWQASEEVEEEVERHQSGPVDSRQLKTMRQDVALGMTAAVVVMFAIMVASAATLGAQGVTTISTADEAARALRPLAGDLASVLFTLGIVGTGLLAVPVLAGSTGYALSEAMGWNEGLSLKLRQAPGFYGVIAGSAVLGLVLGFVGVNPIRSLYYAAILNGIAAPPLILLMLRLARSDVVGDHKSGTLSATLVLIAFLVMAILPPAFLLSG